MAPATEAPTAEAVAVEPAPESKAAVEAQRETQPAHQHDGPVPPSSFVLAGKHADDLTKLEYQLVELLWQQEGRLMTARDICIKLWGDEEAESTRLRPLASRTSKRLIKNNVPATVEVKGGYVRLLIHRQ